MTDTLTRELAALDDALAGRPVDPDLADLAGLAVALRDERPVPEPAFARSLDERADRGFARAAAKGTPRRGIKWPRLTLPALGLTASAALVVVVLAIGIPKGGDPASSGAAKVIAQRPPSPEGAGSHGPGSAGADSGASSRIKPERIPRPPLFDRVVP